VETPISKDFQTTVAVLQNIPILCQRLVAQSGALVQSYSEQDGKHVVDAVVISRTKNGTQTTLCKYIFTVDKKSSAQVVLSMVRELSPDQPCKWMQNTDPGLTHTVFTLSAGTHANGSSVTVGIEAEGQAVWKSCPKMLLILPCAWPHLIACTAVYCICSPCCYLCSKNLSEKQGVAVARATGQQVSYLASPETQMMNPMMMMGGMGGSAMMVNQQLQMQQQMQMQQMQGMQMQQMQGMQMQSGMQMQPGYTAQQPGFAPQQTYAAQPGFAPQQPYATNPDVSINST
jgi:hypothetical protein